MSVRHLVMQGMEDEGKAMAKWLADHVSKTSIIHMFMDGARHGATSPFVWEGAMRF
jgi:hypothetical protein